MCNRVMYMTFFAVCALGMAACGGGEQDRMPVQEQAPADGGEEQDLAEGQPETEDGEQDPQDGEQDPQQEGQGSGQPEGQEGQNPDVSAEGGKAGEPAESPAGGTEQNPADSTAGSGVDGSLYVREDEATEEYKAEDGTVLLTVEKELPVVEISGNEQASGKINEYVREKGAFGAESLLFDMSEEEVLEMAEMHYNEAGENAWVAEYLLSVDYNLARMDDRVISFDIIAYYYLGGAHPNTSEIGLTFDTQTGERLTLEDVVEDKEAAAAAVKDFLLQETGKEEYTGILFSDYEKYLDDLFSETTWYLGEDGFHIIANTYSIAPYVAGSFDFIIPYGQADFLKEEYR